MHNEPEFKEKAMETKKRYKEEIGKRVFERAIILFHKIINV